MIYKIDYKVYNKKELLHESMNRREEVLVFTLFFKINHLSFAVIYQPYYFKSIGLAHFSFHALSRGFEAFTSTGYHSLFVQSSKKIASYKEVKEYLLKKLNQTMDIEALSSKPIQLNLFEI